MDRAREGARVELISDAKQSGTALPRAWRQALPGVYSMTVMTDHT